MMFSTRELIKKLSLGILEEMGFEIAITDLINDWSRRHPKVSINYSYDKNLDGLIPSAFEGRIYRIIQEALTNITKHSNPKNITINFQRISIHLIYHLILFYLKKFQNIQEILF